MEKYPDGVLLNPKTSRDLLIIDGIQRVLNFAQEVGDKRLVSFDDNQPKDDQISSARNRAGLGPIKPLPLSIRIDQISPITPGYYDEGTETIEGAARPNELVFIRNDELAVIKTTVEKHSERIGLERQHGPHAVYGGFMKFIGEWALESDTIALTAHEMIERYPEHNGSLSLIMALHPEITLALTDEQTAELRRIETDTPTP